MRHRAKLLWSEIHLSGGCEAHCESTQEVEDVVQRLQEIQNCIPDMGISKFVKFAALAKKAREVYVRNGQEEEPVPPPSMLKLCEDYLQEFEQGVKGSKEQRVKAMQRAVQAGRG